MSSTQYKHTKRTTKNKFFIVIILKKKNKKRQTIKTQTSPLTNDIINFPTDAILKKEQQQQSTNFPIRHVNLHWWCISAMQRTTTKHVKNKMMMRKEKIITPLKIQLNPSCALLHVHTYVHKPRPISYIHTHICRHTISMFIVCQGIKSKWLETWLELNWIEQI